MSEQSAHDVTLHIDRALSELNELRLMQKETRIKTEVIVEDNARLQAELAAANARADTYVRRCETAEARLAAIRETCSRTRLAGENYIGGMAEIEALARGETP